MSLDKENLHRLALSRSPNIGPKTYADLLRLYGSATRAYAVTGKTHQLCPLTTAEAEWQALLELGGQFLFHDDDAYPSQLRSISDAPPVLSALGNLALLSAPAVALVGARNASASGCRMAYGLAKSLGEQGYVIASGLARGIDAAAHQGALETGTVAVLGCGIDIIYPPENKKLYAQIQQQGLILSEMPLGTAPKPQYFPQRNRIVSGLSRGVVVVEAATRSGSLITARMALEQGREVMAVPGSPLDARAEGPNKLLKQGASLVTSAEDVLEALRYAGERPPMQLREEFWPVFEAEMLEQAPNPAPNLVDLLSKHPVAVEDLIKESGAKPAEILAALLELELSGKLERHPGGKVSLAA